MRQDMVAKRKALNLLQADLSKVVGVSVQSISAYETGRRNPPPRIAERLKDVLGLTTEEMWSLFYTKAAS